MTTAVSEILKQAEQLSPDEQVELVTRLMEQARRRAEVELVARLMEQARRRAEAPLCNGEASGAEPLSQPDAEERMSENDEEEDWLDNLDLKLMPPKRTYMAQARFHYVGRGKPLPYDFGDRFDTENEDHE